MSAQSFASMAEKLYDAGWLGLLPLLGKQPLVPRWPRFNARPLFAEELAYFIRQFPDAGIGLALPSHLVAIDIDATEEAVAAHIEALTREFLGDTELVRVGRWPKRLMLYGTSGHVPSVHGGLLEVFSGSGQVALYGIHPGTGQPYYWCDSEPLFTGPGDLPVVSAEAVAALVSEVGAARPSHRHSAGQHGARGGDIFARLAAERTAAPPGTLEAVWARQLASAIPGTLHNVMVSVSGSMVAAGLDDGAIARLFVSHFAAPRTGVYAGVWDQLPGATTRARRKFIAPMAGEIERLQQQLGLHRRQMHRQANERGTR